MQKLDDSKCFFFFCYVRESHWNHWYKANYIHNMSFEGNITSLLKDCIVSLHLNTLKRYFLRIKPGSITLLLASEAQGINDNSYQHDLTQPS